MSGRFFHAPFISATPAMAVTSVVTHDPERAAQVREDLPGARVLSDAEEIWSRPDDYDLVVVASSTVTHVPLATRALEAGVPVVVEKPLAPNAADALPLVELAARWHVPLSVYHNRRWDSDFLTLRRLRSEGALGDVTRYESRFERWRPVADPAAWREFEPAERGGGVLLDLGVHLVDQAMCLFGAVDAVYAEVRSRRGGADDDVFVALSQPHGVLSHLWAGATAGCPGPRLRVLGARAAFVVEGLDGQEEALRSGRRPGESDFGEEQEEHWGHLCRGHARETVRSEPGRWRAYYSLLAAALRDGGPVPVGPSEALAVLEVLDAARRSARTGDVVRMRG